MRRAIPPAALRRSVLHMSVVSDGMPCCVSVAGGLIHSAECTSLVVIVVDEFRLVPAILLFFLLSAFCDAVYISDLHVAPATCVSFFDLATDVMQVSYCKPSRIFLWSRRSIIRISSLNCNLLLRRK